MSLSVIIRLVINVYFTLLDLGEERGDQVLGEKGKDRQWDLEKVASTQIVDALKHLVAGSIPSMQTNTLLGTNEVIRINHTINCPMPITLHTFEHYCIQLPPALIIVPPSISWRHLPPTPYGVNTPVPIS